MNRVQRYKESAAGMGMRLLSAIPPGPCGQTVPGPPWMLAVEMDADVFDQVERCWAACEGLDLAAGETESVLSELTRLRAIEAEAKAAGFIGEDGRLRKMPKTADGRSIFHDTEVWVNDPECSCPQQVSGGHVSGEWYFWCSKAWPLAICYSTPEAAQAAREGNQ